MMSIKPPGEAVSVPTVTLILLNRCMQTFLPSSPVGADLSLFLGKRCGENILSVRGDETMDKEKTHPLVYPVSNALEPLHTSDASWNSEP